MKHIVVATLFLSLTSCKTPADSFQQSVDAYRRDALALRTEPCQNKFDCDLQNTVVDMRIKQLGDLDLAACQSTGGLIAGIGMFGEPACVRYFSDGGKKCSDSSDCQGNCMVYGDFKTGDQVDGQCATQTPEQGGCFAKVSSGKVQPGICI
jgi:hypothetical protein